MDAHEHGHMTLIHFTMQHRHLVQGPRCREIPRGLTRLLVVIVDFTCSSSELLGCLGSCYHYMQCANLSVNLYVHVYMFMYIDIYDYI